MKYHATGYELIVCRFSNILQLTAQNSDIERDVWVTNSRLCGVVVSVLDIGTKGRGFEPGQGDGFLRAIKISSTPSFGWEVKPEVRCRKILRHVKDLLKSNRDE
jgi:hypothetical protein